VARILAATNVKDPTFRPGSTITSTPTDGLCLFKHGLHAGQYHAAPRSRRPVSPEKIEAYEVGVSRIGQWPPAVPIPPLLYDYKDLQVTITQNAVNRRPPMPRGRGSWSEKFRCKPCR